MRKDKDHRMCLDQESEFGFELELCFDQECDLFQPLLNEVEENLDLDQEFDFCIYSRLICFATIFIIIFI